MAAIWEIAITQNIDSSENFRPTSSFQHQENISARKKKYNQTTWEIARTFWEIATTAWEIAVYQTAWEYRNGLLMFVNYRL